ncbi:uncharacterized protein RCC_01238 [Ramularia collo-cygni]|uniref:Uncharacterized protein n=1 Tax=Ramularia collo-cygni TaxID=112498 RepID=A0A2D3UYX6_9PEZI|nr:uncharacterized protein RCC_01238 [Ramularia collo-cygni]CZT15374.1 uncharacterized protein RCC_01238 [Ramularia collo-cygni]
MSPSTGPEAKDAPMTPNLQSSFSLSPWSTPTLNYLDETMPTTASPFFDLPRELRDMVYTLLYGERRSIKIQTRSQFISTESARRGREGRKFVPSKFPECSISHLCCINKQYFLEAARIWAATKVFQCEYLSLFMECLGSPDSLARQVLQYITEVKLISWYGYTLTRLARSLPRLACVTICLRTCDLVEPLDSDGFHRSIWEDELTDAEFASVPVVGGNECCIDRASPRLDCYRPRTLLIVLPQFRSKSC